jgi:transposase
MTVSLAIDVGKSSFAWSLTDAARVRLLGPVESAMTAPAVREVVARVEAALPVGARVRVGVEAAGHYHRPLLTPMAWPRDWQIVELNPAHVTEQRRVMGRRRVKTDAIDLEAITELLLAARGLPVIWPEAVLGELTAWSAHRLRRVATRAATKNQLLGQLDRSFPGLTLVLPDVLGTKIGRLVAAEFADPATGGRRPTRSVRKVRGARRCSRGQWCCRVGPAGLGGWRRFRTARWRRRFRSRDSVSAPRLGVRHNGHFGAAP